MLWAISADASNGIWYIDCILSIASYMHHIIYTKTENISIGEIGEICSHIYKCTSTRQYRFFIIDYDIYKYNTAMC